jgi:hypothetical protein
MGLDFMDFWRSLAQKQASDLGLMHKIFAAVQ